MLFHSAHFLIFLPIVLLVYYVLPKTVRYLWLLAASYYFYMCWNAAYVLLILTSTLVTYLCGLGVERAGKSQNGAVRRKKLIIAGSLLVNFGILFFFKYFNFAAAQTERLLGWLRISAALPRTDLLLPVGISFYTFQAVGYTVDVYRGSIRAERNFFRYALFVSFFPQLVAGPIERSGNLLSQLENPKKLTFDDAREGLLLMLWGFFLKLVLADRIAILVDTVYGNVAAYPGWYLIVATALFAVQIYCDFSGYTTIAAGSAKLLGIRLMENFDAPYLSASVADFWRRWHISLTSWFRDYLYIPLGGNRKGKLRETVNKLLVFLASGLWHGATGAFVVWGGLNGLYQIVGEMLKPIRDRVVSVLRIDRKSVGHRLVCAGFVFLLVDFSWIFFRAGTMGDAIEVLRQMLPAKNIWILFDGSLYTCGLDRANFTLMLVSIGILLFADCCKRKKIVLRKIVAEQPCLIRCAFLAAAICWILLFGIWGSGYHAANFIYFQF